MNMNKLAASIHKWRIGQGFFTPPNLNTQRNRDLMLGKLILVVSEVSEAAEAVRHKDVANFNEEIADAIIRLFDVAKTTGMDIDAEVAKKMAINRKRPFKHGKLCSL